MKTLSKRQRDWQIDVVNSLIQHRLLNLTERFAISLASVVLAIASSGNDAWGQILGDNTLGAESSLVTPLTSGVFQIDGGATRGTNLFHSFREFSIPVDGSAYFNNALNIENIMTRVTGESVSNIEGLLQANGTANVFLINPNGIIFGLNASLNIGGSFLASTASSLNFIDNTQFSTTNPQILPLLLVSVPVGLQYGGNAGSIQVQGSTLQVPNGKTLALIGGNVQLNGAVLEALGGRVELGGVPATGTVDLSAQGNDLRLSFPVDLALSDISLTNATKVNVRAGGGGSIALNAGNLEMAGESRLQAGIDSGLGSLDSIAGNIEIRATGIINLTDESVISNSVLEEGLGKGGDINITTGALSLTNGASLTTDTYGTGDAGSINIHARDTVSFDGVYVYSDVNKGAVGNGGSVNIKTGSLSLTNGASLTTDTYGTGDAGSVNIHARDTVSFDGVYVYSDVNKGAIGNGGSINITTGSLFVSNDTLLTAETYGNGDAGNVNINARDTVSFDRSIAFSDVNEGAIGNGGSINITTGSLSLTNDTFLTTDTFGQGNAGSVTINARDTVSLDGAYVSSDVYKGASGNGGSVNITTGSLFVSNNTVLSAETYGTGDAGSVNIHARDTVSLDSSTVYSDVNKEASGNGGSINITTGLLFVSNRALLSADTYGTGDAGSVNIDARNTVSFDGSDVYSDVNKGASGNGGSINITTGSLFVANHTLLSAETYGTGDAGSVNIHARDTVSFNGSAAFSDVKEGAIANGGSINITTGSLSVTNGALLGASTHGTGDAGSVNIHARDTVSFDGVDSNGLHSSAFGFVGNEAIGSGGSINITTGSLSVTKGALLSTSTFGTGEAGSVNIHARDTVSFDRGDAFSLVRKGAMGDGGSINITTGSLSVTNGALLGTSTYGTGDAGSVNIHARDTVFFDGVNSNGLHSSAFGFVGDEAIGNGGGINIITGSLSVTNGALLGTSTFGTGDAGSVNINARDTVSFDRGYAFSSVEERAMGNGGSIDITTESLFVSNNATLSASSKGNGVAGNIEVAARSVRLDNQGVLIATTRLGDGGNITLQVQDLLLMRHGSGISATAGTAQAGGDGGNITIDADFVVAVPKEDSDITANAFTGQGGSINITTQGLYGLESRPRLTSLSDITASSEFGVNGTVQINAPDVDPSRGLVNLPSEPVNIEVAQGCQEMGKQASIEFFNTGRGGLAPNPYEPLSSSNLWEDVPSATQRTASSASADSTSALPANPPDKLVEAQGWLVNEKGQVVLVAQMPSPHSQSRCRLH